MLQMMFSINCIIMYTCVVCFPWCVCSTLYIPIVSNLICQYTFQLHVRRDCNHREHKKQLLLVCQIWSRKYFTEIISHKFLSRSLQGGDRSIFLHVCLHFGCFEMTPYVICESEHSAREDGQSVWRSPFVCVCLCVVCQLCFVGTSADTWHRVREGESDRVCIYVCVFALGLLGLAALTPAQLTVSN